jgi:hypothetical protein
MRLFFFLTLLFSLSFAYNEDILQFEAKIFPKLILADKDLSSKIINNQIKITILCVEFDRSAAFNLKSMIERNYSALQGKKIVVEVLEYKNFSPEKEMSSAYLFLPSDDRARVSFIASVLAKQKRLTFAYSNDYLEMGVLFSLEIRNKIYITCNFNLLKQSHIELDNSILRLVKFQ